MFFINLFTPSSLTLVFFNEHIAKLIMQNSCFFRINNNCVLLIIINYSHPEVIEKLSGLFLIFSIETYLP